MICIRFSDQLKKNPLAASPRGSFCMTLSPQIVSPRLFILYFFFHHVSGSLAFMVRIGNCSLFFAKNKQFSWYPLGQDIWLRKVSFFECPIEKPVEIAEGAANFQGTKVLCGEMVRFRAAKFFKRRNSTRCKYGRNFISQIIRR